ncbi:putative DNA helicase [Pseudomonas phage Ep4]|uniref:DNA helicase n=1 Tax=Pseudomonas phage Ep4 TaxID=3057492 RepID=A0AAU9EHX6_9CAUD|nr:putative DNA helicase [Pseudomonas phage Ep4]
MDINILAALRERSKFRQLRPAVPDSLLGQETVAMLAWFDAYYKAFPEKDYVELDSLRSLFTLRAGSTTSPEQLTVMRMLMTRLEEPVDPEVLKGISQQLYERDFAGRAAALLNKYEAGDEIDISYELNRMASENMRRQSSVSPSSYIDAPIEDILADFSEDRGLKLPTLALQTTIAGLQGGDSIAVAGRPDKGKTSFLAATLAGFAPQLRGLGLAGRPMLWLNNEGSGRRIIPRIYQAALGIEFQEMVQLSNEGKLKDLYLQAVDGQDIRVKDAHGSSLGQLEQIIEDMNPCVVVFDMLGNFRAPKSEGGNKTDGLEAMWQQAREMAVRHDFVAMPTIQISADGDNQLYPPYSALKDSKTGVQGACDVILMMGALNQVERDTVRGFSTPKNKRQMPGRPSNVQSQVFFDAPRCRFEDGQ